MFVLEQQKISISFQFILIICLNILDLKIKNNNIRFSNMSIQYSLFIILLVTINVQATWWGLGLQSNLFSSSFRLPEQNLLDFCTSMNGYLTAGQTKLCQLYSDHMTAVSKGAKIGIVECQWQFRYHQWNCSTISNQTVFGTAVNSIGKYI